MTRIGDAIGLNDSASGYFQNGGSKDLAVDGSVTPVIFEVLVDFDGKDYVVDSVALTFNSTTSLDSGQSFMDLPALVNGVTYGFIRRSDGALMPFRGPIKTNMDMFSRDPHAGQFNMAGNDEVLSVELSAGLKIVANSNLVAGIFFAINDDLTGLIAGEAYCKLNRIILSSK